MGEVGSEAGCGGWPPSLASAASCSWLRVLGLAVSSRSPDTREPGLVHSGGFAGKQLVKIFSELLFFIFLEYIRIYLDFVKGRLIIYK